MKAQTCIKVVQLAVFLLGSYIAVRLLSAFFSGTELTFDRDDLMPLGAMLMGAAVVGLIRSGKRLRDEH